MSYSPELSIETSNQKHVHDKRWPKRKCLNRTIGSIVDATFIEGIILEVTGTKGVLRLDLQTKEIANFHFSKDE